MIVQVIVTGLCPRNTCNGVPDIDIKGCIVHLITL